MGKKRRQKPQCQEKKEKRKLRKQGGKVKCVVFKTRKGEGEKRGRGFEENRDNLKRYRTTNLGTALGERGVWDEGMAVGVVVGQKKAWEWLELRSLECRRPSNRFWEVGGRKRGKRRGRKGDGIWLRGGKKLKRKE